MGKRHVSIIIILCLGVALTLAACGGGKIKFGGPTDLGEGAAGSGVDAGDFHETPTGETPELLGEEETQGVDGTTTSVQTVCECPETTCTSGRREVSTNVRSKTLTLARTLKTYSATTGETVTDTLGNTFNYVTLDGNNVSIIEVADGPRITQADSADGTNLVEFQFAAGYYLLGNITFSDGIRLAKTTGESGATVIVTELNEANTVNPTVAMRKSDSDRVTVLAEGKTISLSAKSIEVINVADLENLEIVRATAGKSLKKDDGTVVVLDDTTAAEIVSLSANGLMAVKYLFTDADQGDSGAETDTELRQETLTPRAVQTTR